VLNAFASGVARQLRMPWQHIREVLQQVRSVRKVEPLTLQTHDKALQISERHGFRSVTP
jgi:predicted nucleic acid-binding protein